MAEPSFFYKYFGTEEFRKEIVNVLNAQHKPDIAQALEESIKNPSNNAIFDKADRMLMDYVKEHMETNPKKVLLPYLAISTNLMREEFGFTHTSGKKNLLIKNISEAINIARKYSDSLPNLSSSVMIFGIGFMHNNDLEDLHRNNDNLNAALDIDLQIIKNNRSKIDVVVNAVQLAHNNWTNERIPEDRIKITAEKIYNVLKESVEVANTFKNSSPKEAFYILESAIGHCKLVENTGTVYKCGKKEWKDLVDLVSKVDSDLAKVYSDKPSLGSFTGRKKEKPNSFVSGILKTLGLRSPDFGTPGSL